MSVSRRPPPARSHLPEYATEIAVALVSVGLYAFIRLTEEVTGGDTRGFDRAILLAFRDPGRLSDPVGPAWFEVIVRDVTALGGLAALGLLTVAACGFLVLQHRHRLVCSRVGRMSSPAINLRQAFMV